MAKWKSQIPKQDGPYWVQIDNKSPVIVYINSGRMLEFGIEEDSNCDLSYLRRKHKMKFIGPIWLD